MANLKLSKSKSCSLCNLIFRTAPELKNHIQSSHMAPVLKSDLEYNPNSVKFTCAFCPNPFDKYIEFFQHLEKIGTPESMCCNPTIQHPFHCGVCEFHSEVESLFKYHLEHEHAELRQFLSSKQIQESCQDADFSDAIICDQESSSGAPVRNRFICDHCDNTYSDLRGLKRHLAKVMGVTFQCDQCNKKFSREDVFRKHQKMFHGFETSAL